MKNLIKKIKKFDVYQKIMLVCWLVMVLCGVVTVGVGLGLFFSYPITLWSVTMLMYGFIVCCTFGMLMFWYAIIMGLSKLF